MADFLYQGTDLSTIFFKDADIQKYIGKQLWGCGYNAKGQLGDGTTTSRSSPVIISGGSTMWSQVACGPSHFAMIKTDGSLWTCGYNAQGQLGDSTIISKTSPITTSGGGTTWAQVSCGSAHTAAIKTDGTLWTWGDNSTGGLGDGTTSNRSSPGTTIGGGTTWAQVACNRDHVAAIKTDGTLWTWGNNNKGQLGDGTTTLRSSPGTTIGGGTTWSQISVGFWTTAAIKTDGTLWTWGNDDYGQLGNGTITSRSSPGTTAGAGTTWSKVALGTRYMAAIKTDGTLWTWGLNTYGYLGDGTTTSRQSPGTTTGAGTTWSQVSCGYEFVAAIKTDGTLWTWGSNNKGQLGNNSGTLSQLSPITMSGGGTTWNQVACNYSFMHALKSNP